MTAQHTLTVPEGAVVVGIDGSADADDALRWAADEARSHPRVLVLVHVVSLPAPASMTAVAHHYEELLRAETEEGRRLLAAAREVVEEAVPGADVREVLVQGDPRQVLLEGSARAALVVLGSRGRGPVAELPLGSVSAAVARHAWCPVVLLRHGPFPERADARALLTSA